MVYVEQVQFGCWLLIATFSGVLGSTKELNGCRGCILCLAHQFALFLGLALRGTSCPDPRGTLRSLALTLQATWMSSVFWPAPSQPGQPLQTLVVWLAWICFRQDPLLFPLPQCRTPRVLHTNISCSLEFSPQRFCFIIT